MRTRISKRRRMCKAAALILILPLLTACSMSSGYTEPEESLVVSAIGFDKLGGAYSVTVQIIDGDAHRAVTAVGDTTDSALTAILKGESRTLEMSHCAVAVLGEGIESEEFYEVMDHLKRNKNLTLSADVVTAESAEALLSLEDVSGYDIAAALRPHKNRLGLGEECRFYEVAAKSAVALPHFVVTDGVQELTGMTLMQNGNRLCLLTPAEGAYYMMLRGNFPTGGDGTDLALGVGISSCRTKVKSDGAMTEIRLILTPDREFYDEAHRDELLSYTEKNIKSLYSRLCELYGDIFGYGDAEIKCTLKEG